MPKQKSNLTTKKRSKKNKQVTLTIRKIKHKSTQTPEIAEDWSRKGWPARGKEVPARDKPASGQPARDQPARVQPAEFKPARVRKPPARVQYQVFNSPEEVVQ